MRRALYTTLHLSVVASLFSSAGGLSAGVRSQSAPVAASAAERLKQARAAEASKPSPLRLVGGAAPVPPLSEPNKDTPIVLEVSAFQDGERCALTLFRALSRASFPDRVSFHLLQARVADDADCTTVFREQHLPKLCAPGGRLLAQGEAEEDCQQKVLRRSHAWLLTAEEGEGPAHQRGVANSLLEYHREDAMCLSSDSHMDFDQGWDDTMLADWASTRNEFAVLSAYPANVGPGAFPGKREFVDICGFYLENGIPRGRTGGNLIAEDGKAPYLTVSWAAGLSFQRCHADRNVPVDWHLRWIFTGEEIDRAVRFFTNGYDMYLPTNIAVKHNYSHAKQSFVSFGHSDQNTWRGRSSRRLMRLFLDGVVPEQGKQQPEGAPNFAIGKQRSLEDYVRWSRVDLGGRWKTWMEGQGTSPMEDAETHSYCKKLGRVPVKDEVELVASVGSQPIEHIPDSNGNVKFYGDEEELNVRKVL